MRVKTPRHDELLEMLAAGKYGWKTYFEEAIQLAEKLEFENIALRQQLERMRCCENCKHAENVNGMLIECGDDWRECVAGNYAKWEPKP